MTPNIEILSDPTALAQRAARLILEHACGTKDRFTIALSGGSTPRRLYELLADPNHEYRAHLPWDLLHFFWTDERPVGPNHPDSNYRMANEAMLARIPVSSTNVHRIIAENANSHEAASDYESQLRTFFNIAAPGLPRLDLVLLGMGADGHTASIFANSELLEENHRLVAAPWVEKLNSYRITMTLPLLNNGAAVVFLINGTEKADVLREVLRGSPGRFPAQAIQPVNGSLTWLVDAAAASGLH